MLFAIDIDGTLSVLNVPMYIGACCKYFDIQIEPDYLTGLTQSEFFALPEVVMRREAVGAMLFDYYASWLRFDRQVMQSAKIIPGALPGVCNLADLTSVAYYTARFSKDRDKHTAMVEATEYWLTTNSFPSGERIYCDGLVGKLTAIAAYIQKTGESVVLVDDSYARILLKIADLSNDVVSVVRKGITLVALRAAEVPQETYGIHVVPLRSWLEVDLLIKEVFNETCTVPETR